MICSRSKSFSGHHAAPPRNAATASANSWSRSLMSASMSMCPALIGQYRRPPVSSRRYVSVVGCADEDTLPWLDHFLAAVTWAIALDLAADEGLDQRRLGTRHCVHL